MIISGIQGQSFFDMVIQQYGHIDGLDDMITNNPDLVLTNYVTDVSIKTGTPIRQKIVDIFKIKKVVTQ